MLLALPAELEQREQQMQEIIDCENAPSQFKEENSTCDAVNLNNIYMSGMEFVRNILSFYT